MPDTTFFMPVHSNDEDISFALVTLAPADLVVLRQLQTTHARLAATITQIFETADPVPPAPGYHTSTGRYSEFEFLTYGTGLTPDWYTYPPDTHEQLQDALDDGEGHRTLSEPPTGLPEPERTTSDSLHVDHRSFWFTAYRKHGDYEFRTYPVPFDSLPPNP
jgi:hypothetical protein